MVKVADTPCPKGKRVGCLGCQSNNVEATLPPEHRWDLNRVNFTLPFEYRSQRLATLGTAFGYVRYADDLVVCSSSREQAEAAQSTIQEWLKPRGLELHPEKTKI